MKICLRKLLLPYKAFFVRRNYLRSPKKTCELCQPGATLPSCAETFVHYARRPSKKVKYLRQSATVTAFGHSVYDGLIANIATIHSIFKRGVGDRLTEDSVNSMFKEWPAIDAANQYFTPKAVARLEDIRSIGIDVDPFGSLNKAASSSFVHTEENKVYYFERKGSANGDTA
jgi:hypothetical protein